MAVTSSIRPRVLIAGVVSGIRDLNRSMEKGGGVYGHEVTLQQSNGALVNYTSFVRDGVAVLPAPNEYVVIECSVDESPRWGVTLGFEDYGLTALDEISERLSAAEAA